MADENNANKVADKKALNNGNVRACVFVFKAVQTAKQYTWAWTNKHCATARAHPCQPNRFGRSRPTAKNVLQPSALADATSPSALNARSAHTKCANREKKYTNKVMDNNNNQFTYDLEREREFMLILLFRVVSCVVLVCSPVVSRRYTNFSESRQLCDPDEPFDAR